MKEIFYEGYKITASPDQLAENKRWSTHVVITKDRGGRITMKPFSASNTYETKEDAILHCLDFGKQIIDGNYPDCSLDDL